MLMGLAAQCFQNDIISQVELRPREFFMRMGLIAQRFTVLTVFCKFFIGGLKYLDAMIESGS